MSLFDRKTRLDKAHLINGWQYKGPGSNYVGGEGSGDTDWNPVEVIKDVGDNVYKGAIDYLTTAGTLGLYTDATDLQDTLSEYSGNLTGGALGTSTQERMEAEQATAQLQVDYEGYGRYRGELEKARKDTDAISSRARGDTRLKLAASGIKKGSTEWNRRLTAVDSAYDTESTSLDQQWKDYTKSSEY